jgi:hypothetical protein
MLQSHVQRHVEECSLSLSPTEVRRSTVHCSTSTPMACFSLPLLTLGRKHKLRVFEIRVHSANALKLYTKSCRRVLTSTLLYLIGSESCCDLGSETYKLNLKNDNIVHLHPVAHRYFTFTFFISSFWGLSMFKTLNSVCTTCRFIKLFKTLHVSASIGHPQDPSIHPGHLIVFVIS